MSAVSASPAAKGSGLDPVRALQHTLYRTAKADPGRRFHSLWDKILRREVLQRAWEDVRRNGGAAGIDRITIADVEQYGVSRLLDEVAAALKEGRWRPLPARRVFIPKPGSSEQRPLSIPPVADRVVQAAVKIVLEPIFEADMLPCSFGFRPRRAPHDALQVLIDESWRGRRWVVETDIANCFEAIPHQGLIRAVEERVSDQSVPRLRTPRCGSDTPPDKIPRNLRPAHSCRWTVRRSRVVGLDNVVVALMFASGTFASMGTVERGCPGIGAHYTVGMCSRRKEECSNGSSRRFSRIGDGYTT